MEKLKAVANLREFYGENILPLYNNVVKRLEPGEKVQVLESDADVDAGVYVWTSYDLSKNGLFTRIKNRNNPWTRGRSSGKLIEATLTIEELLDKLEVDDLQKICLNLAEFLDKE